MNFETITAKLTVSSDFYIRSGNISDKAMFDQVIAGLDYNIDRFRHQSVEKMKTYYRDMLSRGKVPVIVDAGANIGCASKYFSATYQEFELIAIEI